MRSSGALVTLRAQMAAVVRRITPARVAARMAG
jgi:hypothetical protein